MYENEKELLSRLCQKSNTARQNALKNELRSQSTKFENWNDMAVIVPAQRDHDVVVVCAHYDAVPFSFGWNDNGMALVTVFNLLHKLPTNVEFVFTNHEEKGGLGAEYYLKHVRKNIKGCINLDVCGCFDQVYLDTMNCRAAAHLTNCKQGAMPYSDAHVFARNGIPSVCFSSGPANTDFRSGIMKICSTIHNNSDDNNYQLLNFEMITKVAGEVTKAVSLMAS